MFVYWFCNNSHYYVYGPGESKLKSLSEFLKIWKSMMKTGQNFTKFYGVIILVKYTRPTDVHLNIWAGPTFASYFGLYRQFTINKGAGGVCKKHWKAKVKRHEWNKIEWRILSSELQWARCKRKTIYLNNFYNFIQLLCIMVTEVLKIRTSV